MLVHGGEVRVSDSNDAFSVTGVAGGLLDESGDNALLVFEAGADEGLTLLMPTAELPALLSVCLGLAGQKLPEAGEADHPAIPIVDWRVGVTESAQLVLALAPQAGGALAFRLQARQAQEIRDALNRALAVLPAE
jgi:hypothetical protein